MIKCTAEVPSSFENEWKITHKKKKMEVILKRRHKCDKSEQKKWKKKYIKLWKWEKLSKEIEKNNEKVGLNYINDDKNDIKPGVN